jgi:hypothetical protein
MVSIQYQSYATIKYVSQGHFIRPNPRFNLEARQLQMEHANLQPN